MKITQKFGNVLYSTPDYRKIVTKTTPRAVEYYKRWGMIGHNGIDVVPIPVCNDISIYSFYAGKIVQILENHIDYGNAVRIFIPELNVIEYHNHLRVLDSNLNLFQMVGRKTLLGLMGNSGASVGAHDHIAFAKVNETCFNLEGVLVSRLNKTNGYLGYIDPMPFLN
jgi:murein DD-endopeptidase MepM/ murein hydrolase activator NlpD